MATKKATTLKKSTSSKAKTEVKKPVKKSAPAKDKKAPAKTTAVVKKASPKKAVKKITKPVVKSIAVKKGPNELLVDAAVEGILELKGKYISVLDLRKISSRVCDYFVICQAESTTQVNAIANSVEEFVRKRTGEKPFHAEGFQNSEWILIDYVTVVVHVFQTQARDFYNLESLWADAEITKIAFD